MGTERKMTERDRFTGDHDTAEEIGGPGPGVGPCLLAPQVLAAGTHYTPTVDMRGYEKCLFDILGGAANDWGATLAITALQCTGASTTAAIAAGAKALAGKAGSKFISDSPDGDYSYAGHYYYKMNRKWLVEVDVEEMDVDNGFRYLQLRIVVSTADEWLLAAEAIRSLASYEPCPQTHADQVIA